MTAPTISRATASRATVLVALGACGFGAISIGIVFATQSGAPLLSVLVWRYLIAALVLIAVVFAAGPRRFERAGLKVVVLAGIGQSAIAIVSLSALDYITAGALSFLFYTYPALVAVIARVRHSEPLTPRRLTALGLSLVGVGIMVGSPDGASLHPLGVSLALASAVLYAVYIPMMADLQKPLTPMTTSMYMAIGTTIVLAVTAVFGGKLTVTMPPVAWYAILELGLVSTAGAFIVFLSGLAVLGPVRTAIISTIEPFFTAVLGSMLLAQALTRSTLIGGAFIAAAVVLLQLRSADSGK